MYLSATVFVDKYQKWQYFKHFKTINGAFSVPSNCIFEQKYFIRIYILKCAIVMIV